MEPLRVNPPALATPEACFVDRRQRKRQRIFTPAYASFHGANALDLHEILDLHEEGLSAQAPPTLELNQHVQLRLVLSEAKSPISASGRLVWSGRGRVGIQLDEFTEENLKALQEWLFINALNADDDAAILEPPTPEPADPIHAPPVPEDRSLLLGALDAVRREVHSPALDMESALNLIAVRAVAFTEATGCAIALEEGDALVCRARAGTDAPPLGARLEKGGGFSGESVRTRSMLRCDDAQTDPRVDQAICRDLGIRSMLAVPLLAGDSVVGLLEVFSSAPGAFRERDEEVLARMAEFAQSIVCRDPRVITVDDAPLTSGNSTSPFDRHRTRWLPLQRSNAILLVVTLALIAFVLGYMLAPWIARRFSGSASGRNQAPTSSKSQPATTSPASAATIRQNAHPTVTQATTLEQLRQLAESGDASAQFGLGAHYAIGDGVKLDNVEAARWFTKAAEQGHVIAQDTMGAYYQVGRGVPKDLRKAYFWSLLGRAGNNETSKYRVATLNSVLSREEIEAARQDAERWIHERTRAPKATTPNP